MKTYRFLFVIAVVILAVSLACGGSTVVTQVAPPSNGNQQPSNNSGQPSNSGSSSDLVTVTDQNNLMAIDLPGDWVYTNGFSEEEGVYWDRFVSPNENAFIENLSGKAESPITGGSNGKIALYFLHKFYSATGAEGDIRISDDSIQPDGSERLTWRSQSGGYSGTTFFEVRGNDRTVFVMLTSWYNNDVDQATLDVLNNAIGSYRIP